MFIKYLFNRNNIYHILGMFTIKKRRKIKYEVDGHKEKPTAPGWRFIHFDPMKTTRIRSGRIFMYQGRYYICHDVKQVKGTDNKTGNGL